MKNKEHCFQSIITIPPYQDGIKVCKLSEKDIDAMYAICISNPYYFACMKSKPTKASLKEDLTAWFLSPGGIVRFFGCYCWLSQ